METVDELLEKQAGVLSRRQLIARGWADHEIARKLRRREWARVHEGIYVDHTGELSWLQHAWAAVLFSWPAALSHESALRAADGPGRRDAVELPIHVMVTHERKLTAPRGVQLHRRRSLGAVVQWNLSPPRVRYEQASIDVAADADSDFAAIDVLTRAVQSRRTTALRLIDAIDNRERIRRGTWMRQVLEYPSAAAGNRTSGQDLPGRQL